jgi:transposase
VLEARGLGKRAKTDAIDAAVLARTAEVAVGENPLWEPLEDEVADLGSVLERRRQLLVLRDAEMAVAGVGWVTAASEAHARITKARRRAPKPATPRPGMSSRGRGTCCRSSP